MRSAIPPRKVELKTVPVPLPSAAVPRPVSVREPDKSPDRFSGRPHLRLLGVRPAPRRNQTPPEPVLHLSVLPSAEQLRDWVGTAASGTMRFADTPDLQLGDFVEAERDYFRKDHACLAAGAEAIAAALGLSPAGILAAVEDARGACYWPVTGGFAGLCAGPGTTADRLLGITGTAS